MELKSAVLCLALAFGPTALAAQSEQARFRVTGNATVVVPAELAESPSA